MNNNTLAFISETLYDFAVEVERELARMLGKKKVNVTGDLLRSLSYQVYKSTASDNGMVLLSFKTYGRLVDMGVGRKRKIENVETNRELITSKGRYPKKWYGKTVYGIADRYLNRLLNGYDEAITYVIKSNFAEMEF